MQSFLSLGLAFVVCIPSLTFAENHVGVIIDGYQKGCIVKSREINYDCNEYRHLYVGDVVTKKPDIKSVQIKWAPYACGTLIDQTSLMVVFEPPRDGKGLVLRMKEALGFLKTEPMKRIGATRGQSRVPQPGNNATLILDEITTFEWESEGGKYIVFTDQIKEIFRKDVAGASSVKLSPRQIGMKAGGTYVWTIGGIKSGRQSMVRVLSADMSLRVTTGLSEIDKDSIGAIEKILMKAVYLQYMSDFYAQDYDLYWLSYLVLGEDKNEILSEEERTITEYLRRNYILHVKDAI